MWVAAEQGLRLMRRGSLLAAIVALPAFASTASAATVAKSGAAITYHASAGETNSTVVTRSGNSFVFTETPGPLTAGTGCAQTSASVVTCTQSSPDPSLVANLLDQNDTFSASGIDHLTSVTFNGGDGNDNLTAPNVSTTLNGDNNNDTLNGGTQPDTLNGGGGDDTVNGNGQDDTLNGDNGNDTLDGGGGGDALNGGTDAGMDRMTGGDKDDVLDGGPGIDRALYTTGTTNITIDNTANDSDGEGDTDNVMDTVESITGSSGNDTITGSCFSNTLAGQNGNDTLNGDPNGCASWGGDFMGGGAGNDTMRGALTPTASDGVDRVTYTSNTSGQTTSITLDGVQNDTDGQAGNDNVVADIEYLYGGPEVDTFNGTSALQGVSFWTGAGNDNLIGLSLIHI
jgi:Ca2+-binding RTX toxin-like protein